MRADRSIPAVFLPGLAGHAAEFDALAEAWVHGPTLYLDSTDRDDLSIPGQARRVAAAARDAGFDRYLVVGHSQGGLVALELAATRPDVVAALAVVDAPILVPLPIRGALRLFVALLGTPAGPALLRGFFRATFAAADGPAHRAAVLDRLDAVPHAAARRIVAAAFGYRAADALARLAVPAAYIRANIPVPLDRLPGTVRGYDLGGAGHWVHVHRPDRVAAVLDDLATAIRVYPSTAGLSPRCRPADSTDRERHVERKTG